jgi:hypothetical protein
MITENAQKTVSALLSRFQSGDIAPLVQVATLKLSRSEAIPAARLRMILLPIKMTLPPGRGLQ